MIQAAGAETVAPDMLSIHEIQEIWEQIFEAGHDRAVTQSAKSLRAAVCGQSHALLCFGTRIECDSLLQVGRDIYAAMKPVYTFTHFPPSVHSNLEPGDESFYVRPLSAALPEWLAQDDAMPPVLFAMLGPRQAVLEVARFITDRLHVRHSSHMAHKESE